ncbi:hypothetical protein DWF00_17900 [Bosea caraganae]|uniref:Uncharacterized protein n=1 Tax=Bosea caraganae TaxID=2763117 RepID=A0A370L8T3_9HYPH|nr:hypothetical protein [Bosea caraganae]RDJ25072.1 hypothetical protein DWF00_17900 [Bosea caraganae]RDJ26182.1 hypothetical protein DWE98_10120 [Bosea caraganae]
MSATEDEIISIGLPYFRVVQPKTSTAAFSESSYLRLGSYIVGAAEEDSLLTGLKTTTSTVSETNKSAIDQAGDAIKNEKGDPAKDFNATSQSTKVYTTTPSAPILSSNNGALIYTDSDLQMNVLGAALQKYGKGNNVEVTTADAAYNVKAGKYDLSAANGVFIKGGTKDAPANIELTAGGYIKQTAYGDLDEVTYGITTKRFHGIANDFFMGLKNNFFFGLETSVKLAGMISIIMSAEASFRLSTRFSLTVSKDLNISLGGVLNIFVGEKMDIIVGGDLKGVIGTSVKIVMGPDTKMATNDTKILTATDIKMAPVGDLKKVGVNLTVCEFDLKVEMAAIKGGEMAAQKKTMQSTVTTLATEFGSAYFTTKTINIYG